MKKTFSLYAAFLAALLLCGCSENSNQPKSAVADFSADAVVTYSGGEQEQAFLTSDLKGISLILNSDSLDGLKYKCDGKTTEISLDGISIENSASDFSASVPYALYNSISDLRNGKGLTVSNDDGRRTVYSGKNSSGTFFATVDNESGYIEKIEYRDISLSAVFSGVKEYNQHS